MSKAAEAFRTISEVAGELEVPKHVLRFWEAKFPQIRPMKRGGGRRYYRPEDMELLRGIRHLLHAQGYTIKGVQKILREQGIDEVKVLGRSLPPPAEKKRGRKPLVKATLKPTPDAKPVASPVSLAASASKLAQPHRAVVESVIAELSACRQMLLTGSAAREEMPVRAARRAGRRA
ncbi:MAG: MerR family transcriptional regulator [Hyphomicrobiaceae bacterium]|nr:MerR family transcriptional regulator [Hyphomicrobiaceae bacterium]